MTHITVDTNEVVRLARDLVAIESHSGAPGREAPIARFLVDWFRERGVDTDFLPAVDGRPNVVARVDLGERREPGPTLLLNGHLDTVPAGEMCDAFVPRLVDGVLWGRGACDMKGAVAAMCCVLAAVAQGVGSRGCRPAPPTRSPAGVKPGGGRALLFAGTVDEETGSLGVKKLIESGLEADYAVVGEPTCLRAAIAHKGACFIRITLTGKGAHGSRPEKGVNAASYGARILAALEDDLRPRLAERMYPLLGTSTVSVGRICGGTEPNIVAERCELDVDRRTLPGEPDVLGEVSELVASICSGVDGLTYGVAEMDRTSIVPHVALGTPPDSRLAQACAAACREVEVPAEPVGVTYWTDGAHLAANGIETVILGPGDIADAHGPNDRVGVADLERAARIYLGIAHTLLRP
ncbi:MAG: M20/M25/M40 family metallo-hydrolase [Candidatus Bipolaricaulis sp.]|nr:M20/M25/M40 family metallo-hydrolase [Candidatus Bipolaricaulis sp.]